EIGVARAHPRRGGTEAAGRVWMKSGGRQPIVVVRVARGEIRDRQPPERAGAMNGLVVRFARAGVVKAEIGEPRRSVAGGAVADSHAGWSDRARRSSRLGEEDHQPAQLLR